MNEIKKEQTTVEILNSTHDRKKFDCGIQSLNNFLQLNATKEQKLKLSTCYIWAKKNEIIGYFTLSTSHVEKDLLKIEVQKKLKQYEYAPTILLGRLAIDQKYQGQQYGSILLVEALKMSYQLSSSIGALAIEVDPINEKAISFYKKFGFVSLDSGKMVLMMKTVESIVNGY